MFLERENNSGKFQNNATNDVNQISLSHVIKGGNTLFLKISRKVEWRVLALGEHHGNIIYFPQFLKVGIKPFMNSVLV